MPRESKLAWHAAQRAVQPVGPAVKRAHERTQRLVALPVHQWCASVAAGVHECPQDTVVPPNDDIGLVVPVAEHVLPGLAYAVHVAGNEGAIRKDGPELAFENLLARIIDQGQMQDLAVEQLVPTSLAKLHHPVEQRHLAVMFHRFVPGQ